MKRRSFLNTSGTIGIASVVSGASVVSSVYSSVNTSVLLKEFNPSTRNVFDRFIEDVKLNGEVLGLDPKFTKKLVMPVQIIDNNSSFGNEKITYKNKSGEVVSISVINGIERIEIS